ncbi:hypothetical protein APED_26755 [Acanthopleuribacter pedis]
MLGPKFPMRGFKEKGCWFLESSIDYSADMSFNLRKIDSFPDFLAKIRRHLLTSLFDDRLSGVCS